MLDLLYSATRNGEKPFSKQSQEIFPHGLGMAGSSDEHVQQLACPLSIRVYQARFQENSMTLARKIESLPLLFLE